MSKTFATDYIDVAARIAEFTARYPEGSLQAEIVELTADRVTMRAAAYRTPDDPRPGIGFAWEVIPGRTPYTKGSELMVCETSAWGRAIAALGIATKRGIATAEEVLAAQSRNTNPRVEMAKAAFVDDADEQAELRESVSTLVGQLTALGDTEIADKVLAQFAQAGVPADQLPAATLRKWVLALERRLAVRSNAPVAEVA